MRRWGGRLAVTLALQGAQALPARAQQPAPASWVEAGGFYHRVTHDYGDWKGGYARAVLTTARDVWYLDARAQEAFRDRGVSGALSNVHSFSSRVLTQLGIAAGTGKYVLPELRLDAALSLKLGRARALLLTAGGTYVRSKSVYRDQALFGSLTWYARPGVVAELGGRLNWSDPGAVRSERIHGALTLGQTGRAQLTLRGSAGSEGYQLVSTPAALQDFTSQEAALLWRQWLSRRVGTVLGGEWYHNPFYTRAGASFGLFHAW